MAYRAQAAGWSREEVATALMELADNHFLATNSNAEMFELGAGIVLLARKPH
ncbi:hypothetical protein [Ensifer sp. 4252]|uniref:hypothetical protein n=1 Tax=Ensifer sp. 4252 TaxID=3373915 RepID=UPI003D1BEA98